MSQTIAFRPDWTDREVTLYNMVASILIGISSGEMTPELLAVFQDATNYIQETVEARGDDRIPYVVNSKAEMN
jgi:hypothetical protein